MSGGQHRDDEGNEPSRSGEREAEGSRKRKRNQPSAAALTNRCAREKQKPKQNVLDGADFVRDVRNNYPRNACVRMRKSLERDKIPCCLLGCKTLGRLSEWKVNPPRGGDENEI